MDTWDACLVAGSRAGPESTCVCQVVFRVQFRSRLMAFWGLVGVMLVFDWMDRGRSTQRNNASVGTAIKLCGIGAFTD